MYSQVRKKSDRDENEKYTYIYQINKLKKIQEKIEKAICLDGSQESSISVP